MPCILPRCKHRKAFSFGPICCEYSGNCIRHEFSSWNIRPSFSIKFSADLTSEKRHSAPHNGQSPIFLIQVFLSDADCFPCSRYVGCKYKKKTLKRVSSFMLALPIFPGRLQPSIVGRSELNFRVRDGNGWTLALISTNCCIATASLQ